MNLQKTKKGIVFIAFGLMTIITVVTYLIDPRLLTSFDLEIVSGFLMGVSFIFFIVYILLEYLNGPKNEILNIASSLRKKLDSLDHNNINLNEKKVFIDLFEKIKELVSPEITEATENDMFLMNF